MNFKTKLITAVAAALVIASIAAVQFWPHPETAVVTAAPAPVAPGTGISSIQPEQRGANPTVALPLHLVAIATGPGVEPRAFIANAACGDARGYSVGDSPLLGSQLVEIKTTEIVLETAAGLRRLPMSTEKCKVPTLRSSSAPVIDEAERKKMIEEKRALKAELERRVQEGKARRASMTPAEISKYDLQSNPECWPDEVPEGKTELDVIPEYCY